MKLIDYTITDFVKETASSSPAPGGGSVSALAGSLAAALASMVIRLTEGKKAFLALPEPEQAKIKNALPALEASHAKLLALIDEDTEAFNQYMAALTLPKATDAEKASRSVALQKAALGSLEVPLKTAQTACSAMEAFETVAAHGNKNAISDIGVAALMAKTAVYGACLNVKINLLGITDTALKENRLAECTRLEQQADRIEAAVLNIVNKALAQ